MNLLGASKVVRANSRTMRKNSRELRKTTAQLVRRCRGENTVQDLANVVASALQRAGRSVMILGKQEDMATRQ